MILNRALHHLVRPTDKVNHYTLIKVFAHIDDQGNYTGEYERHGINQSRGHVDHIRVLACGDSSLDFDEWQIQAFDLSSNRAKLHVVPVEDYPYQKLFDIYFKQPVQPSGTFAVGWTFSLPRAMRAAGDHDFVVLKDFKRGVEKFAFTLEFDQALLHYRFEKMRKNGEWEPQVGGKELTQGPRFAYTLELQNPDREAYKFSYQR
jgi:hypothetical protein